MMNGVIAKTLDVGQRLVSLFLANALPAVTGGAVLGVSVAKSAALAGFMACIQVIQRLAALSVDGELSADDVAEAFGSKKPPVKKAGK